MSIGGHLLLTIQKENPKAEVTAVLIPINRRSTTQDSPRRRFSAMVQRINRRSPQNYSVEFMLQLGVATSWQLATGQNTHNHENVAVV